MMVQVETRRDFNNYQDTIKFKPLRQFLADYKNGTQYLVQPLKRNMKGGNQRQI